MSKTLILVNDKNLYFFPYIESANIDIENLTSIKSELLLNVFRKLKIPSNLFYGEWKKKINEYDKIIVFDWGFNEELSIYLNNNFHSNKYLFVWNSIKNADLLKLYKKHSSKFKLYSFDKKNCADYDLNYNSTFYTKNIELKNVDIVYDVFFLGAVKDRVEELERINKIFEVNKVNAEFYIVGNSKKIDTSLKIEKEPVSYDKYLRFLEKSKVILEIVQENQYGPSLRAVESIFFKKKLITNNKKIKDYDFYNPKNIFILGENNVSGLHDFINTPYDTTANEDLINKYDIESWVTNFR